MFPFLKKENTKTSVKKRNFIFTKFFESNANQQKNNGVYHDVVIFIHYCLAIFAGISGIYVSVHFSNLLGINSPFLILIGAVVISAWIGGIGPALLTTICCTIGIKYFIPQVFNSFGLSFDSSSIEVTMFIIEGLVIGVLLETRKRSDDSLKARVKQQMVIAELAQFALVSPNLSFFYNKVSALVTQTLNIKYCKILELLPGKKTFILRGGIGWRAGLNGQSIVTAGENSQGGYALLSEKPIIIKDLKKEKRFYSPELLTSHGIVSGISVIIPGKKSPFGILGVYSEKKRKFSNDDIYFVQAIANIMAAAIEKKTSETDFRESEIRFKRLFESNIIGAFISEFNGKFLEANDALLSLIGYSREDLRLGKIHRDILTPPKYNYLSENAVRDLQTKGVSSVYEKEYITKSGKLIPVLIAVSRTDDKNNICVGFVLDISKQKELEKRKDEFINMASHELKTPITNLKVLAQFLEQKFTYNKQTESALYLGKMNKQINKLVGLVNDLLDVTKMHAGKLKLNKRLFNIDDLIKEVVDEIQSVTITHTISLVSETKLAVLADYDKIAQVVTNLLTNAIKYSPKKTDILVGVSENDNNAVISVSDSGLGIREKHHKNIFEKFFRVTESRTSTYPGLGMGLYISKEIINIHGGTIWVESQEGKGSTFFFTLPLPETIYEQNK